MFMKRIMNLIVALLTSAITLNAGGFLPEHSNKLPEPRATFDKMWVDYNITENGQKGMRLHVKFTAYDMLYMDAYVAVYFNYGSENGGQLKDKNDKFNSTAGDVAVYKSIKPEYNPAVYNDLQLFMPYDELDLEPGNYDLTMDVKIIYKAGGMISRLTYYDFEYTKPGAEGTSGSKSEITATFKDLWVDYDVTENGRKGMRVHVKFNVQNMKGTEGYVALYFEKKNGDKILSTSTGYKSTSGQLAVYKSINPDYVNADYNDLQLFLPYSELNLGSGRWDLKLDADIIYKEGGLIKHLKYHDFWFEQ
jgi:hypothetical protein